MNRSDLNRNAQMLRGSLTRKGYMRWWHSFSGVQPESGETRTFFVEFFIVNPALGGELPILGRHPFYRRRGMRPSYVLVKAGVFPGAQGQEGKQLHAFYPISALKKSGSPLAMEIGDCFCSENKLTGFVEVSSQEARHRSLMTDAGYMEWDLEIHKAVSCHTGFLGSRLCQLFNGLDSYWHGEGARSFFQGTVVLDGVSYQILGEKSYGYADKHWGRRFNRPWMQLACCRLSSKRTGRELRHSVLAVNGCCPRFFFLPLRRRLMIQFSYTGEDFEFGVRPPFLFSRCKWETKENDGRYIWHIMASSKKAVIKISGSCAKARLMKMRYENPDSSICAAPLWAGGTGTGSVSLYRRVPGGLELLDTLRMEDAFCMYSSSGQKP